MTNGILIKYSYDSTHSHFIWYKLSYSLLYPIRYTPQYLLSFYTPPLHFFYNTSKQIAIIVDDEDIDRLTGEKEDSLKKSDSLDKLSLDIFSLTRRKYVLIK